MSKEAPTVIDLTAHPACEENPRNLLAMPNTLVCLHSIHTKTPLRIFVLCRTVKHIVDDQFRVDISILRYKVRVTMVDF